MIRKISFRKKTLISVISIVVISLIGLFFYDKINSYAYDYPVGGTITGPVDSGIHEIRVNLSSYGILQERLISKYRPNETGLKIIYKNGDWLYMDEYANAKSDDSGISEIDISKFSKGRTPRDIVGFELAAGYEVILESADGEKTTRIMGPLRLLGKSENEYKKTEPSESYEEYGKYLAGIRVGYNMGGKTEKDVQVMASELDFEIGDEKVIQMYNKIWDYNHAKCWSVPGDENKSRSVDGGTKKYDITYDRNNVKIYEIQKIKLKKTTLKDGVYLMRGLYNTLNAPIWDSEGNVGAYDYIVPNLLSADGDSTYEEGDSTKYFPCDLRTKDIVNSIMIVGPYKVQIQREKEKVGKGTKTQRIEIEGQEGKIINIVNFWRLNEREGAPGQQVNNDFSWISVQPTLDSEKKGDTKFYDECVVFKDKDWEKNSYYKVDSGGDYLSRYDIEIKACDIPTTEEDPAVTAYTERDFKGQYFRFYRGETDNIGYDKDIAKIRSLEVGPNTRVIFSDKEDCDLSKANQSYTPNYGKINGVDKNKEASVVVIEGPCAIDNLEEYLLNYYIDENMMDENSYIAESITNYSGANRKTYLKENNLFSRLKSFTVKANKIEGSDYFLYTKPDGGGVFLKGQFDSEDSTKNTISLGNYFPESITINGNYFVKFYDKDNSRVKTLVGPLKNARVGLDKEYRDLIDNLNGKLREYILYTDDYSLQEKNLIGTDRYDIVKILENGYGFDEMATKAREKYLYIARDIMDGKYKEYTCKSGKWESDEKNKIFQEKLKEFAQNYIKQYYSAKDVPVGQSWVKDYAQRVDDGGQGIEWSEGKNKEVFLEEMGNFFESIGVKDTLRNEMLNAEKNFKDFKEAEQSKICEMYKKYDNMTMEIGRSTQRDQKSRSLENTDSIVLYQGKNYNQNVRAEENVWTCIRVTDEGNFIWNGSTSSNKVTLSNRKMEIDNKEIGSIKIGGSLLGNYEIELKVSDPDQGNKIKTIKSRNSIKDLYELAKTTQVKEIAINKLSSAKEFDILLDYKNGESTVATTKGIRVATEDVRLVKAGDFVEDSANLYEEVNRDVYLIDILEVSDKIGLKYEYVYKYDVSGTKEDELVGVKLTRDIGTLKQIGNKQTYQDIDTNVKNIVRDIEIKFNQDEESVSLAIKGTGLSWGVNGEAGTSNIGEYVPSQEYNQTKDSRSLIITDHGYLEDNSKINNDSIVVVKNCRDVMEVPAMLIKEMEISTQTSDEEASEEANKKKYLEIAKYIENFALTAEESSDEDNKKAVGLHLYVPACYCENGAWNTSYILLQLGIKAKNNDGTINLSI